MSEPRAELLIWWTSGGDCHTILDEESSGPVPLPPYIQAELDSRSGRNARGRLWVPSEIEASLPLYLDLTGFCVTSRIGRAIERGSLGGIVFRRADFPAVAGLPGFVTDLDIQFYRDAGRLA